MSTLENEDIRFLFDMSVGSMDFGSGFLDHEEVVRLRRIAEHLGIDVKEATPSNFRASFAHDFTEPRKTRAYVKNDPKTIIVCGYCGRLEENPVHHGISTTEETRGYE
jgi:hypothetical protein